MPPHHKPRKHTSKKKPKTPPSHHHKKKDKTTMLISIGVGIAITSLVASTMLLFDIPLLVVLPTSAPILIGAITLAYMTQTK